VVLPHDIYLNMSGDGIEAPSIQDDAVAEQDDAAGESSNIGRQSAGKNRIWPLTIVVRKGRWKRRPPGSNLLT